ncbi:hypothetical protein EOD39_22074 [Acipenser ruthenus]|uniref:Uncharacterized protein n=1 Tax=Acipenser ruthenus TaxID=7906 RepID=A0A444UQW1_ACIRT|nr:hypothetical protein EOD39_22074 [Acipenser ruthenus]
MKTATTVMSEEKIPTVSIVAPLHAQLLQNAQSYDDDLTIDKEVKATSTSSKEEVSERGTHSACCFNLYPRFKSLPFLSESENVNIYAKVTTEAAELWESQNQQQVTVCGTEPGLSQSGDDHFARQEEPALGLSINPHKHDNADPDEEPALGLSINPHKHDNADPDEEP